MFYKHIFVYLLIPLLQIKLSCSSGRLQFRLNSFKNTGGRDSSDKPCEMLRTSECDHQFTICLSSSKNIENSCDIQTFKTRVFTNQNDVIFSDLESRVIPLQKVFKAVYIKITVMDFDPYSDDDFVGEFNEVAENFGVTFDSGAEKQFPSTEFAFDSRHLSIKLTTGGLCDRHYYGADCSKYCAFKNSTEEGSYSCSADGVRICAKGWIEPGVCTQQDFCSRMSCFGNESKCTNTPSKGVCICPAYLYGDLCTEVVEKCVINPCQNNATCTSTDTGIPKCVCPKGLTGATCSDDIDECGLVTKACGSGECINTFGSYQCNCRDKYEGETCHLLKEVPIVMPPNYMPYIKENPSPEPQPDKQNLKLMASMVVIFLILCPTTILLVMFLRKKYHKRVDELRKSEPSVVCQVNVHSASDSANGTLETVNEASVYEEIGNRYSGGYYSHEEERLEADFYTGSDPPEINNPCYILQIQHPFPPPYPNVA